MNHSLFTLVQYACRELKDTYNDREIRSICRIIFTDAFHYTNIDIHIKKCENIAESFVNKFFEIITALKQGKPIQYILGETEFAGLRFGLNSATLIPRPETEELVHWIHETASSAATLLDIGTGSGCIAVTLAHLMPHTHVSAIDISPEAIQQAENNANRNGVKIRFQTADIFSFNPPESYDIIVSNPPYIREQEKSRMEKQVLDYEPHQALFVPNEDPLLYYRTIAAFGQQHLRPGGYVFFEINEASGKEMIQLMRNFDYEQIVLKKDFYGKDRFIKAKKN